MREDHSLRNLLLVGVAVLAMVLVLLLASEHRSHACVRLPAGYGGGVECLNDGYRQEPGRPAGNGQPY